MRLRSGHRAHAPDPRLGHLSVSHSFLHGGMRLGREARLRSSLAHFVRSGCRESNSGYKHPMLAYYHYTTSRYRAATHTPPTPVWDTSRFPIPSSTGACTRTSHATRDSRPYRAAGNRTRSTRTRIVRTTGILRPVICAELQRNSVCTFVSGKHHKSTSFFYDGVPSRKIGRPRFSHSFLHGKTNVFPTAFFYKGQRNCNAIPC